MAAPASCSCTWRRAGRGSRAPPRPPGCRSAPPPPARARTRPRPRPRARQTPPGRDRGRSSRSCHDKVVTLEVMFSFSRWQGGGRTCCRSKGSAGWGCPGCGPPPRGGGTPPPPPATAPPRAACLRSRRGSRRSRPARSRRPPPSSRPPRPRRAPPPRPCRAAALSSARTH